MKLIFALMLFAAMASAQDVSVADAARANKQKQAAKSSDAAQSEKKKPRVFTNDDVAASPANPSTESGSTAEPETRKFKKGIPVAAALRQSANIRSSKSMLASLEREKRRLEQKADKTEEEQVQLSNLQMRIDMMKSQIAKMEAALYE